MTRLSLFDVEDVEALVTATVQRSRYLPMLRHHELDDVRQTALFAVWRAAGRFDTSRGRFSTIATVVIRRAVIDYLRQSRGRTRWSFSTGHIHERPRPVVTSLDELDSRLDGALTGSTGDRTPDCVATLDGLVAARGGQTARDTRLIHELVLGPSRRRA